MLKNIGKLNKGVNGVFFIENPEKNTESTNSH
jgi:hypothetical protein